MEARNVLLQLRASAFIYLMFFLPYVTSAAEECSLVVPQSTMLQVNPTKPVQNSPGTRLGSTVVCERLKICGLLRFKGLRKISYKLNVNVSFSDVSSRLPVLEVCFHSITHYLRNTSLGLGMCPKGQWKRVKGSWVSYMSPFDDMLLDIRMSASPLGAVVVSLEEDLVLFRVICLVVGLVLMTSASFLSKWLVFYYSGAMLAGVILVILIILFQGMKLLPTGRRSSLPLFLYSSLVGFGSLLLSYVPRLFRLALLRLGIDEDMFTPLAVLLLTFAALAGAWVGFWVVRKMVLTEDGSLDTSTSHFVSCALHLVAAVLVLLGSADPVLAVGLLFFGILISLALKNLVKFRFFHHLSQFISAILSQLIDYPICIVLSLRNLIKTCKNKPSKSQVPRTYPSRYTQETGSSEHPNLRWRGAKLFSFFSNSPTKGPARISPSQLDDSNAFYSTFHKTPERRNFSEEDWQKFTRDSTKKALEELVSSPDFSKWAVAHAERITLTPTKDNLKSSRRWWQLW